MSEKWVMCIVLTLGLSTYVKTDVSGVNNGNVTRAHAEI